MKNLFTLLICILVSVSYAQTNDQKMTVAFNGDNLTQWQVPDDNIWWSIEGESLWAKSDEAKIGSILWTKKTYTDFVIQLDFKFGEGTIDSGIFMRGDDPTSPQIQIGESGSLKRDMTGSPYVMKMGYPVEGEGVKELLKLESWNTIKTIAIGTTYTVWLNGKKVSTYTHEGAKLMGPIGLQLHPGRDMSIQFRKILIGEL
ncbi:MAG: hypothetical protein COA50_06910 [Flavobacteriaceae bacterium]|nr:MAG: hypothetical protein COA50_06910 [Flavobacteriaceae bacterium]